MGSMPGTEAGRQPVISVVIPVRDGDGTLHACLASVYQSAFSDFEVVVVDDGSVDTTAAVAGSFPCTLLELPKNSGAATARNIGAGESRGRILFFLDADILIRPETLGMIVRAFSERPDVDALFGSYTKECASAGFFSQHKNLLHHHTHQTSNLDAVTFCSGFGAVRREVFFRLGGFDPRWRFMEDLEFGHRLHRQGHRILLYKELQMTHCKRYTLKSLTKSDIVGRAIPWTQLILETRVVRGDLNLRWHNLLSVPLSYLILISPVLFRMGRLPLLLGAFPLLFVALNYRFLGFAYQEHGLLFAARSCLMSWFSYLYSGLGLVLGVGSYLRDRWRASAAIHDSSKT
jgi:glycosyltransferase involved in cell wall biosynthesis